MQKNECIRMSRRSVLKVISMASCFSFVANAVWIQESRKLFNFHGLILSESDVKGLEFEISTRSKK